MDGLGCARHAGRIHNRQEHFQLMHIHLALPGGADWDFTDALVLFNEIFNFYRLTVVSPIVQCPSLDGYLSNE
jgi:hypothetical protein